MSKSLLPLVIVALSWTAGTAQQADPYTERLNLGFEAAAEPIEWHIGGSGYTGVVDPDQAHSGKRSLRLRYDGGKKFGMSANNFPVEAARGKRLRLAGYLKSEDVREGWGGLWLRLDGEKGQLELDNMNGRGATGTTDWTRYVIEMDVTDEVTNIVFGALLTGTGTLWVDTLTFELLEPGR